MAPLGLGLAAYLDRRGVATAKDGVLRQGAWRMGATGLSGSVLIGATAGVRRLDRAVGADGRLAALPLSIPVGLATSALIERARRESGSEVGLDTVDDVPTLRGLAAGGAVLAVLYGASLGRAMDRRAGAPARPRTGARLRARLATGLARGLHGRRGLRRQRALDPGHAAHRGRDDDGGPVDAGCARRVDRPDDERRPRQPRLVGLPGTGGPAARRHLRAPGTRPEPPTAARRQDPAGPVDRDRHGRGRPRPPRAGLRRPRQCAEPHRARRASPSPRWTAPTRGRARCSCSCRPPGRATSTTSRSPPRSTSPAATSRASRCSTPSARRRCRSARSATPASRTGCSGCASSSGCVPWRRTSGPRSCSSGSRSGRTRARTCCSAGEPSARRRSASTGPCGSEPPAAASGCTR